jgi:peptidoglycan/LPS O-acetylase OafA/YrhL
VRNDGSSGAASFEGRIWFAQALRGFACLCVVFYHLAVKYNASPAVVNSISALPTRRTVVHPIWLSVFTRLEAWHFDLGQFGVALFFLISGFVIPFSLRRVSLPTFAVRRVIRIYPVYWCALLILVGILSYQSHKYHTALPFGAIAVPFNALIINSYAGQPSIDQVNWTLAIEDLFYITIILVSLTGLLRRPAMIALSATLLAGLAIAVGDAAPQSTTGIVIHWLAFNATFVTFILVGTCWHYAFNREWSSRTAGLVGAWVALVWAASLHYGPAHSTELGFLVSSVCAAVVFAMVYKARGLLPRSEAVSWLANISYPLYLVHGVIGYVLLYHLMVKTGRFYLSLTITLTVVIAAAWALHRILEIPSITLGRRMGQRMEER